MVAGALPEVQRVLGSCPGRSRSIEVGQAYQPSYASTLRNRTMIMTNRSQVPRNTKPKQPFENQSAVEWEPSSGQSPTSMAVSPRFSCTLLKTPVVSSDRSNLWSSHPVKGTIRTTLAIPQGILGIVGDVQEGFQNMPLLYGSKVRQRGPVTNFKSGLIEGGKVCTSALHYLAWTGADG